MAGRPENHSRTLPIIEQEQAQEQRRRPFGYPNHPTAPFGHPGAVSFAILFPGIGSTVQSVAAFLDFRPTQAAASVATP